MESGRELGGLTRRFWPSLALLSSATLVLEVSLTRVLSVTLAYHFAYMVVSIAFLGLGAGGLLVMLSPRTLALGPVVLLRRAGAGFAVTSLPAYLIANRIPFDPAKLPFDSSQPFLITLYYLVLAIPFVFTGMGVAGAFRSLSRNSGRLYFFDLLGASLGALCTVAVFSYLGGFGAVLASSVLAWGAYAVLPAPLAPGNAARDWIGKSAIVGALALSVLLPSSLRDVRISEFKDLPRILRHPEAQVIKTRWNAISRVDAVMSPLVRYAPGLSLQYTEPLPTQLGLTLDGGGLTGTVALNGGPESSRYLDWTPEAVPFTLKSCSDVLVLGPGAASSLAVPVHHGAKNITAVIPNVDITHILRETLPGFSFAGPRFEIVSEGERAYLAGQPGPFDLILVPMAGGSAASTGMSGFSEEHLLTVEGIRAMLSVLKSGGMICVTRYLLPPPRGDIRMLSVAVAALEDNKEMHPEEMKADRHLALFRSLTTITMIIKREPFSGSEREILLGELERLRFDAVLSGVLDATLTNRYIVMPDLTYESLAHGIAHPQVRDKILESYLFDLSPVTDDRPYYDWYLKLPRIKELYSTSSSGRTLLLEGGLLLPLILAQAAVLASIVLVLPLLLGRGKQKFKLSSLFRWRVVSLFVFLGLGYMLVEVALIHKLVLYLGAPVRSVAVVLCAMLVSSGLGALVVGLLPDTRGPEPLRSCGARIRLVLALVAGVLLVLLVGLVRGVAAPDAAPLVWRYARVILILMIPGFVMGMPFPVAMRMLGRFDANVIPWAWSANACASVAGAVASALIAVTDGYPAAILAGALMYVLAFLLTPLASR